jgi:hypothetical protein
MSQLDVALLAAQIEFAAHNMAHNLDFVPADKLDWKPAEKAKSVLEIINHVAGNMAGALAMVETGAWDQSYTPATTIAEAKTAIVERSVAFAERLRTLQPADLEGDFNTPAGVFPKTTMFHISAFDPIHHHGQICYLQTLWGDDETHLENMPG